MASLSWNGVQAANPLPWNSPLVFTQNNLVYMNILWNETSHAELQTSSQLNSKLWGHNATLLHDGRIIMMYCHHNALTLHVCIHITHIVGSQLIGPDTAGYIGYNGGCSAPTHAKIHAHASHFVSFCCCFDRLYPCASRLVRWHWPNPVMSRSRKIGCYNDRVTLNVTGMSAALLLRSLSNFRAIKKRISRLRDLTRSWSCDKTCVRWINRGPGKQRLII